MSLTLNDLPFRNADGDSENLPEKAIDLAQGAVDTVADAIKNESTKINARPQFINGISNSLLYYAGLGLVGYFVYKQVSK